MGADPLALAYAREGWAATLEERLRSANGRSIDHIDFDARGTAGYLRYRRPVTEAVTNFIGERTNESSLDAADHRTFYETLGRLMQRFHDEQVSIAFFEARAGLSGLDLVLEGVRDCPTIRRHAALFAVRQAITGLARESPSDDDERARGAVLAHLEAEWTYRALGCREDELLDLGEDVNRTAKGLAGASGADRNVWRRIAGLDWFDCPAKERDERIRRAMLG